MVVRRSKVCVPRPPASRSAKRARTPLRIAFQAPIEPPTTNGRDSSRVWRIFSPPGTSPTPVRPALSLISTTLRVKNGPCAPLRLSSMLSWPATGTTVSSVTTGVLADCDAWDDSDGRFIGMAYLLCTDLFDQRIEHLELGIVQIGERRTHRTRIAADKLRARLHDTDRIARAAVADFEVR